MSLSSSDLSAMPWSLMTPSDFSAPNLLNKDKMASISAVEPVQGKTPDDAFSLFGNDGFTFADMMDIINPLQHLPIIAPIYREISGDHLAAGARIAGDTLYGGPIGFATGILNAVVEAQSGTDIGGNILAMFSTDKDNPSKLTEIPATSYTEPAAPPAQIASLTKTKPEPLPALLPAPLPVAAITISELVPLTPPVRPNLIDAKKPETIIQPNSLTALQMNISTQMALQIAQANDIQFLPPEKTIPVVKADKKPENIDKDIAVAETGSLPSPSTHFLPPKEAIGEAMAAAIDKYQQIYANPG